MTNIDPRGSDVGVSDRFPVIGRTVIAIGGGLVLVFLAGIASGYISVMVEERSVALRDALILGAIALGCAGVGYGIWRYAWRTTPAELSTGGPGEQRTLQRQRRQMLYIGLAGVIGGVIGALTGFFDQGDGSLFGGDWENLKLPPMLALGLAVLLIGGFLVLPLWGFRMIDDYKREQNFIAFTGGCVSVLAGYPVWAVLYAGGFTPPPHAFGIFGIAYVSMIASFLYARWRL
jgi:MFS family permease